MGGSTNYWTGLIQDGAQATETNNTALLTVMLSGIRETQGLQFITVQ